MGQRLLKKHELAKFWGVSEGTVDKWVREGRITAVRTPGGYPRFVHPEDDGQSVVKE